ncbi:MAG: ABC transporter substrate-binding protein, partial [Rhodocyclaceae bacterium]
MKTDRRRFLLAAGAAALASSLPARADALEEIKKRGSLRIAVYNNFAPYSN